MHKSILRLEATADSPIAFRTTIKTRHGRTLFLALENNGSVCTVTDCFYTDRNQGRVGAARYKTKPKKLRTLQFPTEDILSVIETELDKKFYGVEFVETEQAGLSPDEYLQFQTEGNHRKYRFLIMVGDGDNYNGLPMHLRTRLKTKLHRSVYVELAYYKDGKGVVKQCCYYDREYRRQGVKITPPMLINCFFPYTKEGILDLLNHEICCDFTHMLVTEGLDLDSNTTPPLRGNLGGIDMANLKEEYTDTRDRTHKVEHILVPAEDKATQERIVEELFQALARTGKKIPA